MRTAGTLNRNPPHLVERDLIARAVVELGLSLSHSRAAIACAFSSVPPASR